MVINLYFPTTVQLLCDCGKRGDKITLNGFGDSVIPSNPTKSGSSSPSGTRISNECINDARNRNMLDFAKCSPIQRLFPIKKKKKTNNCIVDPSKTQSHIFQPTHPIQKVGNIRDAQIARTRLESVLVEILADRPNMFRPYADYIATPSPSCPLELCSHEILPFPYNDVQYLVEQHSKYVEFHRSPPRYKEVVIYRLDLANGYVQR